MKTKTTQFKQTVTLNTTPEVLYDQLMDSRKHSKFTGATAKMSKKIGAEFSAYEGYAYGKNVELVPNKKIVQTWRARVDEWPEDILSIITYDLQPIGKDKTKIVFTQKNIPEEVAAQFKKGWIDYYWDPLRRMFN